MRHEGDYVTSPPVTSTTGGDEPTGNIWTVLGDLVGAGADVAKSLLGKKDGGGAQVVFVPQSGIDATLLKGAVILIVVVIAWKLFKK